LLVIFGFHEDRPSVRVDILCSSRELFGADRSALRLARVLRDCGVEPRLVLPEQRPELGLASAAAHHKIDTIERPVSVASRSGVEEPLSLLSRNREPVDLVIINSLAVVGDTWAGRRKIVMVREWLEPHSAIHRALTLRHRIGASAVVGVSSGALRQWRRCIRGPQKQFVVHNWLEDDAFQVAASAPEHDRAGILCLGRFNQWKGQEVLAEAFELAFGSSSSRPSLAFVGAQPGTVFEERGVAVARRGLDLGWRVEDFVQDPTPFLRRSSLVVVPSMRPEPFGNVILEALVHGNRVIAFPGGGPDDLAEPFADVLQVVPRSAEALATALSNWWETATDRAEQETTAVVHERLKNGFSANAARLQWEKILSSLPL
jgi:glycosyltransferase involved in cell wall biosynthesis